MEIYVAYKDYNWMMDFTEKLLEFCAVSVNGTPESQFGEHTHQLESSISKSFDDRSDSEIHRFDITGKLKMNCIDFCEIYRNRSK